MEKRKYGILIVGAGKVGVAVGSLLLKKGHRVVAAVTQSRASLDRAASYLPDARLLLAGDDELIKSAAEDADIILITTKDENIAQACASLAASGAIAPSHSVFHMSGASSLKTLAPAMAAGACVASIHPIQSFATIELAIEKLPGSYFGVTADGESLGCAPGTGSAFVAEPLEGARGIAYALVSELSGKPIDVADENKVLYHAAACIASNYLVSLLNLAEQVYMAAGFGRDVAVEAMMPLVKGTVTNIESVGTVGALTGPIARGDAEVVRGHIESLEGLGAEVVRLYKALGMRTVDVALQKGTIGETSATELSAALQDD